MQDVIHRLGLFAGEGHLPVEVAKNAMAQGIPVDAFCLFNDNTAALKAVSTTVHRVSPGLLQENIDRARRLQVSHLVFAGKVNKWLLMLNPRLDERAAYWLKQLVLRNDDAIMLSIIKEFEEEGFQVTSQTRFLTHLFQPARQLSDLPLHDALWRDLAFGYPLVKEMGRLDIGQTIVVKDAMVLAVEAIEGTDECLRRAGKLARNKGGTVIKVAKPKQDQRFDVPTVGLRTLKTMHSVGLDTLATEANTTLYLDLPEMQAFSRKHGLRLISFDAEQLKPWQKQLEQEVKTMEAALLPLEEPSAFAVPV